MEMIKSYRETIVREIYKVKMADKIYILTWYLNDANKIIDIELRDNNGISINDPELLEKIEEFVEEGIE